jgi:S1-C subfamily serine protease
MAQPVKAALYVAAFVSALIVVGRASTQQVQTLQLDASRTVFIHELGAAVGVTDDNDAVRFIFVAPPEAMSEAARNIDVRRDDIVLMMGGQRVRSIDDFRATYEAAPIGEDLKIGLKRGNERFLRSFVRAEQPQGGTVVSAGSGGVRMLKIGLGEGDADVRVLPGLGAVLQESDGAVSVAAVLPLPDRPASPLAEGDRIVSLAGAHITSVAELMAAYEDIEVGARIAVTVDRQGETVTLELTRMPEPQGMLVKGGG